MVIDIRQNTLTLERQKSMYNRDFAVIMIYKQFSSLQGKRVQEI